MTLLTLPSYYLQESHAVNNNNRARSTQTQLDSLRIMNEIRSQ